MTKARVRAIRDIEPPANPQPFDIASIKPPHGQMDGSGKFSPNLYRWIAKWGRRFGGRGLEQHPLVYRAGDGSLWIGHFGEHGWFTGARVMRVLCNGARNDIWAVMPKDCRGWKPVPNFWRAYRRIGRCAIDRKHETTFTMERWTPKGKTTRECLWCGKTQRRTVRTVVKRKRVETWK